MRTIEQTGQFKRDYKRKVKGPHRQMLASDFIAIITALANDLSLAEKHHDHALTGNWKDHRDCHVKPDLVLICRKRMTPCCSLCVSARIASLACERPSSTHDKGKDEHDDQHHRRGMGRTDT